MKKVNYEELSKQLINDIIEELKYYDIEEERICFMISPLCQSIKNNKEFLDDINNYIYDITYKNSEEYLSIGILAIDLYDEVKDEYLNYIYEIEFSYDERLWGYCECSKEDKDYDERYKCCGHGCDWSAPKYSIRKIEQICTNSWEGDQHDYWDFKDNFYNVTEEEKEKEIKNNRIKELEEMIKRCKKELDELKNK